MIQKYGQDFEPNQIIFQENDEGKHIFIIHKGRVQISQKRGKKERVLAILEKGDFFGEMAVVSRVKRTATAIALEPTTLLTFDRFGLEHLLAKEPQIALNIIDKLCRRLQVAHSLLRESKEPSISTFVATLCELLQKEQATGESIQQIQEDVSLTIHLDKDRVLHLVEDLIAKGVLIQKGEKVFLQKIGSLI